MSFLISVDELESRLLGEWDNTVVVDVRFDLTDPDAGRKDYLLGHIPGAVYLDLNKDLSGNVQEHGGNHPLPDPKEFAAKLGSLGINQHTTVVVYDNQNDMFAPRLYWLLQYIGHDNVYILDGGYGSWKKAGKEVSTNVPSRPTKKEFVSAVRHEEVVGIERIKENIESGKAILIDSRAKDRYLGKIEPLYSKAGHIPGAKNFFWKDVLKKDGFWKNEGELQEQFAKLNKDDEIIVSCGSGVSACPNVIALKQAGFKNVKLYPGSFSDWISYEENKVETKEE